MPPAKPDEAAIALFGLLCGLGLRSDRAEVRDQGAWGAIVAAARRHALAPLLFWRLSGTRAVPPADATPSEAPPPHEARAALRNAYLHCLAANLRARRELEAVVSALAARGISPILLKGAHLAFGVYPDPGLRPMCDLDLLVERAEVPVAMQVLADLGYAPIRPFDLESEMALLHHLPPYGKPGCHYIEIHWALLRAEEPYRIDTAGLWARSRPAALTGIPARVLDPADLLPHLCLHAAAADRLAGGLRPLADIVEVLRAAQDDPTLDEARDRAANWGASRCLSLMLSLCEDLAPGALPPETLHALMAEPVTGESLARARALILAPPGEARQISPNLARAIGSPSAAGAREILRGFFPSRAFLATVYGVNPRSAGICVGYPRRWGDLLRRYALPALKAIAGERQAAGQAARQTQENELAGWLAGGAGRNGSA